MSGYFLSNFLIPPQVGSPCVNAGSIPAGASIVAGRTTRTDLMDDGGIVDLGYHYP